MGASMPRPDGSADTVGASRAKPPRPPDSAPLHEWAQYQLALQAVACDVLGSGLYANLLTAAATDIAEGGPTWTVLKPHAARETDSALALRFMAAIHRMVLERRAPELAAIYPSVGGSGDVSAAWPALRRLLAAQPDEVSELVARPCQTNEVGRCVALMPGFLVAARQSGLPLRLLEIGGSGGLNLRWDHYRYEHDEDERAWGPDDSEVRLRGFWDVPADLLETRVEVVDRAGCDSRPIDPTTQEGRTALSASVWADQVQRFERLRGALQLAGAVPASVTQAAAGDWLPQQLGSVHRGVATVVYHSVVLQYIPPQERHHVIETIADAGARATARSPLFWVRMEPEDPLRAMSVRFTAWPGGREQLLATAGAHGFPLRWSRSTGA